MRVDEKARTRMESAPADPFLGRTFGGYRVDEEIGRGGMGVVYKATQLSLSRPVALKVLPAEYGGEPQFVERFHREVDVLSRLSHPNVVTVIDRGEVDGRLYVVMEYVAGASLREVMKGGPLPAGEALLVARGVLAALEHAHERGVVHRDIKPENVLLAPGGIVKVADFGLSRLLGGPAEATRLTHTNLLLGTFEYMAPEQRERAREADERSDIYATGVVLYEMLAGELPIGKWEELSRKRPAECDARLDEIVGRSLRKAPEERYQRAADMGAELSRLISSAPVTPPSRASGWCRRSDRRAARPHRAALKGLFWLFISGGTLLGVFLLTAVMALVWRSPVDTPRPAATATSTAVARGVGRLDGADAELSAWLTELLGAPRRVVVDGGVIRVTPGGAEAVYALGRAARAAGAPDVALPEVDPGFARRVEEALPRIAHLWEE